MLQQCWFLDHITAHTFYEDYTNNYLTPGIYDIEMVNYGKNRRNKQKKKDKLNPFLWRVF